MPTENQVFSLERFCYTDAIEGKKKEKQEKKKQEWFLFIVLFIFVHCVKIVCALKCKNARRSKSTTTAVDRKTRIDWGGNKQLENWRKQNQQNTFNVTELRASERRQSQLNGYHKFPRLENMGSTTYNFNLVLYNSRFSC